MPKIIKVTKKQLDEVIENDFEYLSSNSTKPFDGQSTITADGKLNGETNANPRQTDDVGDMMTPQSFNRYRLYGTLPGRNIREGVKIQGNDNNNADDTGETPSPIKDNSDLNTLTNGKDDDLTRIPQSVIDKVNLLLDNVYKTKLSARQKAIVLNKVIEDLNTNTAPPQLQRKWTKDIKNGLGRQGLPKSSEKELENEAD